MKRRGNETRDEKEEKARIGSGNSRQVERNEYLICNQVDQKWLIFEMGGF